MNRPPGHVRVIGGRLRGSKLPVAQMPGLRPTGDRARETLFNWLQDELTGIDVLDAFAGSGALGFEAASRGANSVLLLEREPRLAASLRESATRLHVEKVVQVECADALGWLRKPARPRFGLAFLDPPFDANLHAAAAKELQPWLLPRAWIYVELAKSAGFEPPPPGWRLHRENATNQARHLLFRAESEAGAGTLQATFPGPGNPPA
jgi:16S rRNA (guanine966-N2)-methyltransferase